MAIKSVKEVVYSILDKIEDILARITSNESDIETNKNNISTNATNISNKVGKSGDTMTGRLTINTTDSAGVYYTNTGSSSAGTDTKLQATSWSGDSVWFGVGSGGSNRGIYDSTSGTTGWMVYKDSSNSVHLGSSTVGSSDSPIYLSSGVPTAVSVTTGTSYNGYPIQKGNGFVTWQVSATAFMLTNTAIPSGYRPAYRYRGPVLINFSSDNGWYNGCLQIGTDGSMTVYFYASYGSTATSVTSSSYEVTGYVCYRCS